MEITGFVSTLGSTSNLPTQPKQHFKPQPVVLHLTELWILSLLTQLQLTQLMLYLTQHTAGIKHPHFPIGC